MFVCRSCLRRCATSRAAVPLAVPAPIVRAAGQEAQLPRRIARSFATSLDLDVAPDSVDVRKVDWKAKQTRKIDWSVQQHLKHAEDPFKIAQIVDNVLAKGRYDEALALARKASVDRQCVVSWNHLINHLMENQRLHAAIKLFNEVCRSIVTDLPNSST